MTRMSGKIVIVGYHQGAPREIPLGHWNWMAFNIVNAHFREVATIMRGMTVGMRLLTSGRLSLDGWSPTVRAGATSTRPSRPPSTSPRGSSRPTVTSGAQ